MLSSIVNTYNTLSIIIFSFILSASCNEIIEAELFGLCYNIEKTTRLNISGAGLNTEIPPQIGNLYNLYFIDLSNNRLSGEIPSEIGKLINLNFLYLQDNNLSGEIPSEIGGLINLKSLLLYSKNLSGEIP